jgi:uncharacterized protein YukE
MGGPNMELLDHRVTELEENHEELKDVLKDLTNAINKLAIIDEKQVQSALIMDRLSGEIKDIHKDIREAKDKSDASFKRFGERLGAIELQMPKQAQTSQWVYDAVKAMAVIAGLFVLKKAGLL